MPWPETAQPTPSLAAALCWLLAGLILEGLAVFHLLVTPELWAWRSLPLHLMAAPLLTAGLWQGIPVASRRPAAGLLLFLMMMVIWLPVVAPLGLALSLLPGLRRSGQRGERQWQPLAMPDLPFRAVALPDVEDPAIREGLASVLSSSHDHRRRQQAVLACRHLPRRQAIPILRQGLADSADDVRLLAYSMLSGIERDLDGRVQALVADIERQGDPDGNRAEALAALYSEYGYLQLAQGGTLRYLLEQATLRIDQALAARETAHRWLMLGRLCIALKHYPEAEAAFMECETLGMHDDDLAPYRAELAFTQRRFNDVHRQLARLSSAAASHPTLHPLVSYWQ
ncbi:hypothetical protein [Halomonas urumqiensis]|uniref:HEAT repeat domain-containing protein n=1 Tax=Halomonas urumqiensis TaxID=1684789 RepID=A0A2N7UK49_9GAMM|nr:hypothetical protein [Halomonas urumqiensis]PMR80812.1 hypothetical protein C1H70_07015 [Halomonas urumqiensis]PTB02769.1 hypothetical protein C6V82_09015 [Halomonas urumqiensis]GHE21271.1 pellicle/biofilm biosynthesis protein PelE [Halomonas urumqiensis]